MKVILIKDCKNGKKNQIIEVADGYAKNFLIRQKLALPINSATQKIRKRLIDKEKKQKQATEEQALQLKNLIEKTTLHFQLKQTKEVVHNSISKKQILTELKNKNIILDVHAIEKVHINSVGTTIIPVKLDKKVKANLKVEVEGVNV